MDLVLKDETLKLYDSIVWEDPRKSLWEQASVSWWEVDSDEEDYGYDVKDVDEDAEELRQARVEEFLEKQRAEMLEEGDQEDTEFPYSMPVEVPPQPPSIDELESSLPPAANARDELGPSEELFTLSPDDEQAEPEAAPSKPVEHSIDDSESEPSAPGDPYDD